MSNEPNNAAGQVPVPVRIGAQGEGAVSGETTSVVEPLSLTTAVASPAPAAPFKPCVGCTTIMDCDESDKCLALPFPHKELSNAAWQSSTTDKAGDGARQEVSPPQTVHAAPAENPPSGPRDWADWQNPIMRGYVMKCCDCGLEHEMEFRVGKVDFRQGDEWMGDLMPEEDYRVQFRLRRI